MIGAEMVHDAAQKIDGFPTGTRESVKALHSGAPRASWNTVPRKNRQWVEAVALNLADNADAKMETLTELFDAARPAMSGLATTGSFESNIRRTGDFS